jgi:phosphate transport system substrate-binding protein
VSRLRLTLGVACALACSLFVFTHAAMASTVLIGSGSSFAAPEVLQWTSDTATPPYSLSVDYTATSSGDGRFNFGNNTVDFAVSDLQYQSPTFDTAQPTFPFIYVPFAATGVAFMYHLDGLPAGKTLQLSSYSICSIMTGGATMWNDPIIAADNPGLTLPSTPIAPVIRADLSGTNLALQEYCIHDQPAMWSTFATSAAVTSLPNQVTDLSATTAHPDWPLFAGAVDAFGSASAADQVGVDNGSITAVEPQYAVQRSFPVASVKNASGNYTQPTSVDVTSALAYATQNTDGSQNLDFDGLGANVYNPSTYSYLLTPTAGWSTAKGATLSQFLDYALTLGQQEAPSIGYAPLGLPLEQYALNEIQRDVPGAVGLTSSEQAVYQCGDLTPAEVQQGQTTPTCPPPAETPEAPWALALPLGAGLVMILTYQRRGRRRFIVSRQSRR